MTDSLPKKAPKYIADLKEFDSNEKSLHISGATKNMDRLKELSIENLWLIGGNDKELRKILPLVRVNYLNLYQVLAKDLTILETQDTPKTIILNWNTKATTLWDISKNQRLKTLEIIDFSKLEEINQLSLATQIDSLTLNGGHNKPMKIKTLKPLEELSQLRYLSLTNLKIEDDTLKPLARLKNLEELDISNQFETREFAWLASRLPDTECKMFNAVNTCSIENADSQIISDTMVTGRRKPFLLSSKDKVKIDKYIKDFEEMRNEYAE